MACGLCPVAEPTDRSTLINSPFWTVHPVYVRGFVARNLTILSPLNQTNTDGIECASPQHWNTFACSSPHGRCAFSPDSTSDVLIEGCYIRTGDDAIAIKAGEDEYGYGYGVGSHNITVRDCVLSSPCAAFAIGSEMSGNVTDVHVKDSTFVNTGYAFRIKTGMGRGGAVERVSYTNCSVSRAGYAFMYAENYGGHPKGYDPTATPTLKDVRAVGIRGDANNSVAQLLGLARRPARGIVFEDVDVTGGRWQCAEVFGTASSTPGSCECLSHGCKGGAGSQ